MDGSSKNLGSFHTACWVLGLIAFVELGAVGLAFGLQNQQGSVREGLVAEPQIIEQVRVVTDYKPLPGEEKTVVVEVEKPVYLQAEIPELPDGPPIFEFEEIKEIKLDTPKIASPLVERYVEDSRKLRIAGDSMRALLKLEEAANTAPEDANVLYQFAEVYSTMGLYDRAADYYQQVFGLGTVKAGSLYDLAAIKLRDGFEEPEDMAAKFALGRVRVYRDTSWTEGERVILTVPVSAAPELGLDADELTRALTVQVFLYDEMDGKATPRDETLSSVEKRWVTQPVDWAENGEELLRVVYEIPSQAGGESHLFGHRKYFGQVVELFFENALIDKLASPRRLAREVEAPGEEIYFYPENYVPADFNIENPLLPPLPE